MKVSCIAVLAALVVVAAGCATTTHGHQVSASIVDFLYPKGDMPAEYTDETPRLPVPLTVGLAFVPRADGCTQGCGSGPSAAVQAQLLERVRDRFRQRSYIRDIKAIPASYPRAGKGFVAVDQIARLYGFDVIALVSYDQVAVGHRNSASILYWTIAGAYVIPGNSNEVHTFVDTAVLDVKTRKLLLRAPGIDVRSVHAPAASNDLAVMNTQATGLDVATNEMIANLDIELSAFLERIKGDNSVIVTRRDGTPVDPAAGALGTAPLVLLIALAAFRTRRLTRKHR